MLSHFLPNCMVGTAYHIERKPSCSLILHFTFYPHECYKYIHAYVNTFKLTISIFPRFSNASVHISHNLEVHFTAHIHRWVPVKINALCLHYIQHKVQTMHNNCATCMYMCRYKVINHMCTSLKHQWFPACAASACSEI